jgi:hypothetical protein
MKGHGVRRRTARLTSAATSLATPDEPFEPLSAITVVAFEILTLLNVKDKSSKASDTRVLP